MISFFVLVESYSVLLAKLFVKQCRVRHASLIVFQTRSGNDFSMPARALMMRAVRAGMVFQNIGDDIVPAAPSVVFRISAAGPQMYAFK